MDNLDDGWLPAAQEIRVAGGIVTKRATVGRAKLLREVEWLESIPGPFQRWFPTVLAVRTGDDWAEYDMPYFPWANFSDSILSATIGCRDAVLRLQSVVHFLFDSLYAGTRQAAQPQFFRDNYIVKMRRRLNAARGRSAMFDRLLDASAIHVNGKLYRSPAELARLVEERARLCETLQPPDIGIFHGDFKPDNILLDLDSEQFVLIDPRGTTATGDLGSDYLEDIAKLRTSTLALYDIARAGGYDVKVDDTTVNWEIARGFRNSADILSAMDRALLDWMPSLAAKRRDVNWRLRLIFITSFLLIANAPFQLVAPTEVTENIAIVLYTIGTQLLNEALTILDS